MFLFWPWMICLPHPSPKYQMRICSFTKSNNPFSFEVCHILSEPVQLFSNTWGGYCWKRYVTSMRDQSALSNFLSAISNEFHFWHWLYIDIQLHWQIPSNKPVMLFDNKPVQNLVSCQTMMKCTPLGWQIVTVIFLPN
jgi:hypothetical protein